MTGPRHVLSLFPGLDLLGAAFEEAGFYVVRGPDVLWGGDVSRFHVRPGQYDGLIGGPPCVLHSRARKLNRGRPQQPGQDLIGEYVRIWREGDFRWSVMENVEGARNHPSIPPEWGPPVWLRDWDCGGYTFRRRLFWCWPFWCLTPPKRPGRPAHSVLASTGKRGHSPKVPGLQTSALTVSEAARLQGAEHLVGELVRRRAGKELVIRLLGNGVPLAMGRYIAAQLQQTTLFTGGDNGDAMGCRTARVDPAGAQAGERAGAGAADGLR